MKMFQVNQYGCYKEVFTTSLGRKVKIMDIIQP